MSAPMDIDFGMIDDEIEAEAAAYMAAHPVVGKPKKPQPQKKLKKPKPPRQPRTESLMIPSDYAGRIHRGRS